MVYHYCSNETAMSILRSRSIWMSDVQKSNDSTELRLFYPNMHRKIFEKYVNNPFQIEFIGRKDEEAIIALLEISDKTWERRFEENAFSNMITCFSEEKDSLSQWRGYANDGRGCCIGFSREALQGYCNRHSGVLRFEKVEYLTEEQIVNIVDQRANFILEFLKDRINTADISKKTTEEIGFEFDIANAVIRTDSLKYKSVCFQEEREWRIFFTQQAYKNPQWVNRKKEDVSKESGSFERTLAMLDEGIEFRWTADDLIPYYPIRFDDFPIFPVCEIWLGPKNKVREADLKLFLSRNGYDDVKIGHSKITYR